MKRRRGARGAPIAVVAFAIALAVSSVAGCGGHVEPTSAAMITGIDVTDPPPATTPWPNGTVGRYGVRVDPTLLSRLPPSVGGEPLVEAPEMEKLALDSAETATTVESIASATAGSYGDTDWATVQVLRLRPEAWDDASYSVLRDQLNEGACSQAGGIDSTGSEVIAERTVDVATCLGEVFAYTFKLDARTIVSVVEMGPRKLGHQLLEAIP